MNGTACGEEGRGVRFHGFEEFVDIRLADGFEFLRQNSFASQRLVSVDSNTQHDLS